VTARHQAAGGPLIDGVLLVDKPAGVTSHDAVMTTRRALGERRIGHAGTLDPFATGLLVMLVGRATRLLPYIDGEPKVYDATIRFGAETNTGDLLGEISRTAPLPAVAAIDQAISQLTGTIEQIPPTFSAKRVGGRRAHEAARAGEALTLRPVMVRVDAWLMLARRADEIDVRITCGGGTYIRALARDLGAIVNSAAHLTALRRLRSGAFHVADAATLDSVRDGRAAVLQPLAALPSLPIDLLSEEYVQRVVRGLDVPASSDGPRGALVNEAGTLVALAERCGDRWQPRVVMRRE